jgi:hypothetical protein
MRTLIEIVLVLIILGFVIPFVGYVVYLVFFAGSMAVGMARWKRGETKSRRHKFMDDWRD